MNGEPNAEPWERLEELVDAGNLEHVEEFLDDLPLGETVRAVSRLNTGDQSDLVQMLDPEDAAELMSALPEDQAIDIIEQVSPAQAAAIVCEMNSDEQADLLSRVEDDHAEAILLAMDPEDAADVRRLQAYSPRSAGGLMNTEYLAYGETLTVADVLDDLRSNAEDYATYDVQYAYVVSSEGKLVGVLRLRDLLLSRPTRRLDGLMIKEPGSIPASATLEQLEDFFDRHAWIGVPVLDEKGNMVGVVRRVAVEEAASERSEDMYRKLAGVIGGEELRSMSWTIRSGRRLSWLSLNIILNLIAASVISAYQETLEAVITLAVFLPMISDMSGCAGNQAVAVSMRELVLGLIKPYEVLRVVKKELIVGLVNGLALGVTLGLIAYFWKGNPYLGFVVGSALAVNTCMAACLGGCIPLILRALKLDPALVSGPLLTTFTDMAGFLLVLGMASWMLPQLTGA